VLEAYGVSFHRHNSEIEQTIRKYTKSKFDFTFTPHLSPMFRGILSTIYIDLNKGKTVNSLYNELIRFYKNSTFVKVIKMNSLISTNDVINTNNCLISVCKSKYKNKAIILSSIDNLIKGGAGQGVQNMNIIKNFNIKDGLK
jgi:N-acetyl-gamma-glutamyl-phosphate reductase